ncbi:hypothetical protein FA15DRAFT_642388 [Coprinopsis marcescibilis]|uniref:Uncharacterized protein n=1 Tax=Coprinopsis marcescibilis TaxID=230819 RepID=A0A5C3KSE8_COPMA|nr:hypothetical protein FA15DRAFT_642388 [Coprinopsis marcescibilis]
MAKQYRRSTLLLLGVTCALNVIVILLLDIYGAKKRMGPTVNDYYSYQGHDYPETLPLPLGRLDNVLLTVEETRHYSLSGNWSDAQWESLPPKSGGFLSLGPDDRFFLVSMFHQLHCLRFFNWAFDAKFEGLYKSFAHKGHNGHCLNYLRQVALCSADLTLESGDFEARNFEVDRVGSTHVCNDWSAVYSVLDMNIEAHKKLEIEHD